MKQNSLVTAEPNSARFGPAVLLVGVTGHRDIDPAHLPRLKEQVDAALAQLRAACPATRIVVMSALAEGADRLVAEVARKHEAGLVVPLPMKPDIYAHDFQLPGSCEEFSRLLAQADSVIELPLAEGVTAESLAGDEHQRALQYELLAEFQTRHSYIMLALWDGLPSDKLGGTARTVAFKLHANSEHRLPEDLLASSSVGPVVQIVTPRLGQPLPADAYSTKYLIPDGKQSLKKDRAIKHLAAFNRDCARLGPLLREQIRQSASYLIPDADAPMAAEPIRQHFAMADALALHFQQQTYPLLCWHLVLMFIVAIFLLIQVRFFLAEKAVLPNAILVGIYGSAIVAALIVNGKLRRQNLQNKYFDYRTLAEGLRIQYFWHLAGLKECAANHYTQLQHGELGWIRHAMWGSWLACRPLEEPCRVLVETHWVRNQHDWLEKKSRQAGAVAEKISRWWQPFVMVGLGSIVLAITTKFMLPSWLPAWSSIVLDLAAVLVSAAALVATGLQNWSRFMGYDENERRYKAMAILHGRAMSLLEVCWSSEQHERWKLVVRDLGKQALTETGDWLWLHRLRTLVWPAFDKKS